MLSFSDVSPTTLGSSGKHISVKNTFLDVRDQEKPTFQIRRFSSCPLNSVRSTRTLAAKCALGGTLTYSHKQAFSCLKHIATTAGEPSLFTNSSSKWSRWSDLQDSEDGFHIEHLSHDALSDELPRQTTDTKWKEVHMSANKHLPSRTVYMSEDPWTEVRKVNPVHEAKKKKQSRPATAKDKKKDLPTYLCTFFVGIEDEPSFTVVKRIIGPQGRNMKYIAAEARGSKIRLRGRGSMFKERDTDFESEERLQINISVTYLAGYERAKELVKQLLNNIYFDHERIYGTRPNFDIWEDPKNP